ncbi:ABC transporter permease [Clostridium perfringens]|uniref:ABC transporter permease n=1 Tax=Clostridium perfringens TaxID=1502 RepID=UPI001A2B5D4E|nr:ABC transporter permease [Clostridium perfringens]MBO3386979.1 ABC transporter permease [Clostridium perfringens]MBO3412375.1 ABC transporter permease [Clostridium perfringens]HAT4124351.1 ABC transporter permease [Clostridium perfringens]HAT4250797.1 ABC transporter permease [Clostridium perfringens]HAT4268800.1 ABC transporter permease [Clostridium perfringens]
MKFKQCIISLMAILLGLIAGAILMAIMGHNPIDGYSFLFQGGLMNIERIGNTLATATPLILTGLSLAFAFRTGLFNIGAPGQMLMGGFFATAVGLTVKLPALVLIPLMILAGILGGALWAFIPGALKAKFNVHEVVSTIMMNWIAYWIVYYMVPMYFKGEFLETESAQLPATATLRIQALTDFFQGSFINMGILIALVSVFAIWFILNKTVLGYELKAVGFNRDAAEYAGISVNRNIVLSMMIAGALAGLAGVVQYTGNATSIQIGVMPTQGFDGIAVALLGASNPIGVLFSALFFGILYTGKGFMNAMTSIPPEIADTIMATIIYFAATSVIMERVFNKFQKRKKDKLNKNTNQETTKERVVSK